MTAGVPFNGGDQIAPLFFQGIQVPLSATRFKPVYQSLLPRAVVKIDGNEYVPESYRLTMNAHGATDTATITFPIGGASAGPPYPDWTRSIERSERLGNANTPVSVEIWAGFTNNPGIRPSAAQLTKRFSGIVDNYEVDLDGNRTIMTCRSLAAPLTMFKITTPFAKEATMTSVAFVQQAVAAYGLSAKINVPGSPGTMLDVLGSEYVTGIHSWFLWDLILQCAQYDDVDVWVDRFGVLHYEAPQLVSRQTLQFVWGENIKMFAGSHAPQFSKNIVVQVHSWTKKTKTANVSRAETNLDGGVTVKNYTRQVTSTPIFGTTEVLQTSTSSTGVTTTTLSSSTGGAAKGVTGISSAGSDTGRQIYKFFVKNKTLTQCAAIAQNIWRQISMHEYAIKVTAPVTLENLAEMDVTAFLDVSGSPMQFFNDKYWPRQIDEDFDPKRGWLFIADAVNHTLPQGAV